MKYCKYFLKWKENYWIIGSHLKEYVDWLEGVIDGRIHGIVSVNTEENMRIRRYLQPLSGK